MAAGADPCAKRARRGNNGGVKALREGGVGEVLGGDLKVARDDERETARSRVSADGGEDGEGFVAEASACDEVKSIDDGGRGGAEVDFDCDGAPRDRDASADGARGAVADEHADSASRACASAWDGGGSGGCFACGETNEFGGSFEVLPEGDGVGSRASAFADANKGLNLRVRDSFEVGVVVCAGDGDSGGRRAALGAGGCELGVHGGAVGFGGVEFRVEARGGGGKLGLAARETVDAVIDLTKCRKGQDGGAAGGILLDSTTFAAMAS